MSGPSVVEDTPKPSVAFNLETILSDNHEAIEHSGTLDNGVTAVGWDEEGTETQAAEGYCVECEDQPAQVLCETCSDAYCE
ncbi:hypothetical protein E4T56_gene20920, partial [Termitomyces sp. T112]